MAAGLALVAVAPANAVTLTFASFSYVGPAQAHYNGGTGVLSGVSIPIKFNYVSSGLPLGFPATGYGSQNALLSFTASSTANAGSFAGIGFQAMNLSSFAITVNGGIYNGMNLLSGSVNQTVLSGTLGGTTATHLGSMGAGATVTYASDFLTFPAATDADLGWTLTSVDPPLALAGNNFSTFDATVAGTFGYNVATVPEASSFALLGVGLAPLALALRKRRSTRA
jgi:hypothetical protein